MLVRRRPDAAIAQAVAPGNRYVGLMLPYTPIHHLLCDRMAQPIVLTSGNVSDEPIAYQDDDALRRLGAIADFFLTHDRPIHTRTDDSVVRVLFGRETPIRRSRGYAPQPLTLPLNARRPILACGAELKNTFCLAADRYAFVSHHIGDLENYQSLRAFSEGIEHFRRLFEVHPQLVVHDLHPEYLSTKYAFDLQGVELIGVQHHHAHIAACLADNGEQGPAIGVAFDGLGYGADATIWGGEFLVADLRGLPSRRIFRAGADAGRDRRDQAALADGAGLSRSALRRRRSFRARSIPAQPPQLDSVAALAPAGINSPMTSSAGRLFDAVAAIVGVRDFVNYEGQAAIELEQMADVMERGAYRAGISGSDPIRISGADLVRAVIEDIGAGTPRENRCRAFSQWTCAKQSAKCAPRSAASMDSGRWRSAAAFSRTRCCSNGYRSGLRGWSFAC